MVRVIDQRLHLHGTMLVELETALGVSPVENLAESPTSLRG